MYRYGLVATALAQPLIPEVEQVENQQTTKGASNSRPNEWEDRGGPLTIKKYFGLKKETKCDCGCGQKMPAREDIAVMVDRDSYPARRYIPGHEPGARNPSRPTPAAQSTPAPSPAPAAPTPKAPPPSPAPPTSPPAEAEPKNSVSVVKTGDERPWVMVMVTINTGNFESVKVGIADYGEEAEKVPQLASRVSKAVFEHVEEQVHSIKDLHARMDKNSGVPSAPTSSPARAGVPSPSPSSSTPVGPLPSCDIAGAVENHYTTQRTSYREEILEMKRAVDLELLDIAVVRRGKKEAEVNRWLLRQGYDSLNEAAEDYPCVESVEAFRELVSALDAVNSGSRP